MLLLVESYVNRDSNPCCSAPLHKNLHTVREGYSTHASQQEERISWQASFDQICPAFAGDPCSSAGEEGSRGFISKRDNGLNPIGALAVSKIAVAESLVTPQGTD